MSRLALLALAVLAAPVAAQAPGTRQIKIDVSPAGQAVLKRYLGAPDPFVVQRVQQLRATAQQMQALSSAPRYDLVRLQALMRQQEALEAAVKRHNNDRMIAMLRELSEADRLKFVNSFRTAQALANPPAK